MNYISIKDIKKAKSRIQKYIHHTPIFKSSLLNHWLGHDIYFKAECLQKIGAFKARGACNTVAWLFENKINPKHIIANSSGNHAQAVAYAASRFGIKSTIFMPAGSSKIKIQATKDYGADVVLCVNREIADKKVELASKVAGTFWVHPFNHEQVIAGQGTAVFDALTELGEVDAVFAPCGGGGLLSGSVIASHSLSPKAKVIGAEPLNGNDAVQSLHSGSIQKLKSTPNTLADGAMTLSVGSLTFEYLKLLDDLYEVEESQIIYWTQWLTHLLKVRVEPTSAMAMDAAIKWLSGKPSKQSILVVLSGGNIDQQTTSKIWSTNCLSEIPSLK